jgi:phospholipid/cholesterol/gamma-HCH transport system permease protein
MFLVGSILSLQSIYQMEKLGVERFVPDLIGVSFLRELAPLITAVMISARVGAAITAELGSMKVSDQVLALETLAISPVEFLVVPRIIALLIVVPCLTLFSDLVGILGGAVAGLFHLEMSLSMFFRAALLACVNKDLVTGLLKSVAFGAVIGLVACHEGLNVEGGARGVGAATTRSVVNSIILIVAVDLFFTAVFFTL